MKTIPQIIEAHGLPADVDVEFAVEQKQDEVSVICRFLWGREVYQKRITMSAAEYNGNAPDACTLVRMLIQGARYKIQLLRKGAL